VNEVAQQILNGLSLGSTYALLALGLATVYSILNLVNFAHGELVTVAAYAMLAGANLGLPFAAQVVAAVVAAALVALLIELIAFRPLRGASFATLLFASFALSVIIQNLLRSFVGARQKTITLPEFFDQTISFAGLTLGVLPLLAATTCLTAVALLSLFLRNSTQGLGMLAAAQDFQIARLVGVPANRVIATAFALSGVLAALAAVFIVARRGTVDPAMGFQPVIAALIGTVIGGLGSLKGAVFGGFILGGLEVTFSATMPDGFLPYSSAMSLTLVILILLYRPRGLLTPARVER
jgi:branched-chain amino acid transport system permease protein